MDDSIFILVTLAIILGLIAGLYYMLDRQNQHIFDLATAASSREESDFAERQRFASMVIDLLGEVTMLIDTLKTQQLARGSQDLSARASPPNVRDAVERPSSNDSKASSPDLC